ncbi:MAG: hypothetical protein ACHQ4H_07405 [Ktedonobacterales bacterium]
MTKKDDAYQRGQAGMRGAGSAPPRRLALSGLIEQRLASTADRDQLRARLVNAAILAQAIFTAAATAGYVNTPNASVHLGIGAATVVVYLAALVAGVVFRRVNTASYILVLGGLAGVTAQTITLAVAPSADLAAQASLLFIALILEASLLFTAETTLLVAFVGTVITAFALLLSLSLTKSVDSSGEYLLLVYTLGLQALTGVIAWLVARYIVESSVEVQRAEEVRFLQARLDAQTGHFNDQQTALVSDIEGFQAAITRALGGETMARAEATDEPLGTLAMSLNILLERLEQLSQADMERMRMGAVAFPMLDALARMADAPTPTPSSLPIMTNTSLDSVQLMLAQAQANIAARMTKVQRLTGEMLGVLGNSQGPLESSTESVQEAYAVAGLLVSACDTLLKLTSRQRAAVQQRIRQLAEFLPDEVTGPADALSGDLAGIATLTSEDLSGLGRDLGIASSGLTGTFPAIEPGDESSGAGIAPMTVPMRALQANDPDQRATARPQAPRRKPSERGDMPLAAAELVNLWNALNELEADLGVLDQEVAKLGRDLSAQSRTLRSADGDIAYLHQAWTVIAGSAEKLQQLAGAGLPVPPSPEALRGPASRPLTTEGQPALEPQPSPPDEPAGNTLATGSLRASDLPRFSGNFSKLDLPDDPASGESEGDAEAQE